jgi:hypothetical protein
LVHFSRYWSYLRLWYRTIKVAVKKSRIGRLGLLGLWLLDIGERMTPESSQPLFLFSRIVFLSQKKKEGSFVFVLFAFA